MTRMVNCVKLGRELPGLDKPPFPGDFGKRVFENISQQGWQLWKDHQVILINHYGLNMADPSATNTIMEEMEKFFFADDAKVPEEWVPEGEGTGSGMPSQQGGKGAPEGKGAPAKGAPQRK